MDIRKGKMYEEFARFVENPTRETLREFLRNNVGELPHCDFKEQWPQFPKFAHHLLGLGNSGGGCTIIGIAQREDNAFEPKGLETLIDKAVFFNGIKKFLPDVFLENVETIDFAFQASEYPALVGKKFQVVVVQDDPHHIPFVATGDGDGIRNNTIYTRRGTSTEIANHDELQRIINRRLETGYSTQREIDLETHLEQLKILFRQLDRYHVRITSIWDPIISNIAGIAGAIHSTLVQKKQVPNPIYPEEDLETFIVKMIGRKKKRIEIELDVVDLTD